MHTELVERRKWISDDRFLHALNYCMLLPGPEAQQLAIYIGWLLHRVWGGIAAGALFVLPSALLLWGLSYVYVTFGTVPAIAAIFFGLKPVVLAVVASAVIRIGRKALKNSAMISIAGLAFVAIYFFAVPFPVIVIAAALTGLVGGRFWEKRFLVLRGHASKAESDPSVIGDDAEVHLHTKPTLKRALKVSAVSLVLWWTPVVLLAVWLGPDHALVREGIFFSKASMVTFGGAYAVLPYVSQLAVEQYHWLNAGQMLDGLALAETTPGPLIMVLQFVGFLGAWNHPAPLSPLVSASLGAFITTWTTFVPCFLWIFLGAPHIEQLRGNVKLTAALSAVTAAVVGVVLNLAVWFGAHVLFPEGKAMDWLAFAIAAVAFFGIVKWKWNIIYVVAGGGAFGLIYKTLL